MILVGKFCDHLPLNRQSAAFAREGIELEVSTLADWVGGCAAALEPILAELRGHVLAAERLHVDDTTVKVLAKMKTRTGRLWVYVRDDRPFGGQGPPAALYDYSPTRHGEYPRKVLAGWSGVMQADAFSGYNALYDEGPLARAGRRGPVLGARAARLLRLRQADQGADRHRDRAPHRRVVRDRATINGQLPEVRRAVRQERSKPLVAALEAYMREQLGRLSPKNDLAKAIRYMLTRWAAFTRFLDDGKISPYSN